MGPQYQATIDSYAASPQAAQSSGNQTLGKSLEQSPVHDGFGTRSSMYDNGMDVSARSAPTVDPPQPQNQPATAGINPSWAQQMGRKRGGRTKRADGGYIAPGFSQLTVGAPQEGPVPGALGGTRQIPQSQIPLTHDFGPNQPSGGGLPAFNPVTLTPEQQAAGLAAFNKPGPQQGFASAPLSEFGSMYNQPGSMMMTGDTLARFGAMPKNLLPAQVQNAQQAAEIQQTLADQAAARQAALQQATAGSTLPPDVIAQMKASGTAGAAGPRYTSTAQNLPTHYPGYDVSVTSQKLPDEQFLAEAYKRYGFNAPDPEAAKFWTEGLKSGTLGQSQIEASLANYAQQSADYVNQLFQSDVGRKPTPEEAQYWTDQLNMGGLTRQDVENAIMNSAPGAAYLQSQGVTPEAGGAVDPFTASYNAQMGALQSNLGNTALLNYLQNYMAPTPKTTKP